jgi:tRNA (guanine-N7-)-methyltransferase
MSLPRRIRSFVQRQGRMTRAQGQAFDKLLPKYGVTDGAIDPALLFPRGGRLTLEIGFGDGATLVELARRHPDEDFLGIEVHRPGVGRLLMTLEAEDLSNVRVICADAVEVLAGRLPDACLDAVLIYFPDPWPKKRHHKRRLLQAEFAALLAQKLKPGGRLHLATDWPDYALHMLAVLETQAEFRNTASAGGYVPRPPERPATKFERRGLKLGHPVFDLVYLRR